MNRRIPRPRAAWEQLSLLEVVLECAECHAIWEPENTGADEPDGSTPCPHCGGWVWVGELMGSVR